MIVIKYGDIFNAKTDVICHQVNCRGIMGAGLAKQIKEKYHDVFIAYRQKCIDQHMDETILLGDVQLIKTKKDNRYIGNLFAQAGFGLGKCQTDYTALQKCLNKICQIDQAKIIAIPYKLGCGLAGGDWDGVVYPMIQKTFGESQLIVEIWKKSE